MFTDRSFIAIALLVAGLGLGCGHPGKHLPIGTYERGQAEYDGEVYLEAIEDLKLFIRRSPTDERADDAQFLVGRAYMELEDYPVAAVEFEILRADYPNSELVDDAYYMEGLCYVEQVPGVHLDQAITEQAAAHFRRFLRDRPEGTRHEEARQTLRELNLHLDQKRLRAVQIYMKIGRWEAAKKTVEVLLTDRADSELRPEMLHAQSVIARKLDDLGASRRALEELVQRFPEHELAGEAERLLGDRKEQLE